MSATADPLTDPELLETAWDLDPLVEGEGEAGVDRQLDEAVAAATEFADRYAGKVAEFDIDGLAQAMHELARIHELIGRAGSYAALRFSTDTADPTRGALLQRVQERGTELETKLLFFDLEWAALDDTRAEELLALPDSREDELEFCRHHLRTVRRYRPHLLSEKEEKLLAEK
jgi:oligoendopeptidase F